MYCLFIFKNCENIFLKCLPSKIELFGEKKKGGGGNMFWNEYLKDTFLKTTYRPFLSSF